jgi:hypothetical protein
MLTIISLIYHPHRLSGAHQERLVSLIFPAISARRKDIQDKYRQRMDHIRHRVIKEALLPGTPVMIKDPLYLAHPELRPASEQLYIGPYVVVRQSLSGNYQLKDETGEPLSRNVPLDQIKLIKSSPALPGKDEGYVMSEARRIDDHRFRRGQLQYLVQWKDGTDDQWVAASGINDTSLVTRYFREREVRKQAEESVRTSLDIDNDE